MAGVAKGLSGRRALVTGAASGIGRATAVRLAAEGAAVIVDHVGQADEAERLVTEIGSAGGDAAAFEADVSDEDQVADLFTAAEERLGGPVDLLVNNAGVQGRHGLVDMPLREWERVISINLTGAFLCARACARALVNAATPGVIVNVTSVHEEIPWPGFSHYAASKGGLKLFSQSIARELAPHGIRVLQIGPGATRTPINEDVLDDPGTAEGVKEQVPLGRWGEPEEMAAAIAWLASDEASYVTGATLFVDGGMTLYPGVD